MSDVKFLVIPAMAGFGVRTVTLTSLVLSRRRRDSTTTVAANQANMHKCHTQGTPNVTSRFKLHMRKCKCSHSFPPHPPPSSQPLTQHDKHMHQHARTALTHPSIHVLQPLVPTSQKLCITAYLQPRDRPGIRGDWGSGDKDVRTKCCV